jgi:prepilin-type N-terminal cleavage/methylation domain-containing protein
MRKRLGTDAGLTITEVLAALSIFLIVATGLASATVAVIRGNSISRTTAAAAALVQGKIEEFRSFGSAFGTVELTSGRHEDPGNPISPLGKNGGAFRRSWVVTSASPRAGLARVEVTVNWDAPQAGSLSSVTLICENPSCM